MRLVGFVRNGRRHMGAAEEDDRVRDLGPAHEFWADPYLAGSTSPGEAIPCSHIVFAPPVPETSRIFCVGVNYRDHAAEAAEAVGRELRPDPMVFGRWQQSLVVDGTAVPVPPNEDGLDWEVELAVVMGRSTWAAREADALDHVYGYTAFNDLSARRKQYLTSQVTLGKNADRSGPIGPVLVTADEFGDPAGVHVETRVNGQTMQSANTKDLIHNIGQIIEFLTDTVTLLPGDVIATGTPGGVGFARKPPVLLHPGDVVEVEIERIGVLRTPIVHRSEVDR